MCRLLYVDSREIFSINQYLNKFAKVAKNSKEYQGHGWGFAYWQNSKWNYYKNILPIWEDEFPEFGFSKRILVHARSAFQDKDICVENNMPFYDEKYIFVFNGELRGVKIKSEGRIGAEKIFNYIKRFVKENINSAFKKGIEIINKRTDYVRAMNVILVDNYSAQVCSFFSEDPEYFTLRKIQTQNKLIICSEEFPENCKWEKIENNFIGEFKCLSLK